MISSISNCRLALYADDSALIVSHTDSKVISERLSYDLANCQKWLIDNKLSLHVGKTESILFGSSRKLKGVEEYSVTCNGQLVKRVTSVKYLGVFLDEKLSGLVHVADVIKKCAGRISFLYRNASLLNFNCRRLLCSSLVNPYLDYCSSSWFSGLTKKMQNRLHTLQRRMVRFVYGMDARGHVGTEKFRDLSWLVFKDRVIYFKLCHVFKIRCGMAPTYLCDRFHTVSNTHSHNTRGSLSDFHVSKNVAACATGFSYTAISEWNGLPYDLKQCRSFSAFRSKLKQHLASSY